MTRHLLTSLCPGSDTGHVMSGLDGKCSACSVFVPNAPTFSPIERERLRDLRVAYRLGRKSER